MEPEVYFVYAKDEDQTLRQPFTSEDAGVNYVKHLRTLYPTMDVKLLEYVYKQEILII